MVVRTSWTTFLGNAMAGRMSIKRTNRRAQGTTTSELVEDSVAAAPAAEPPARKSGRLSRLSSLRSGSQADEWSEEGMTPGHSISSDDIVPSMLVAHTLDFARSPDSHGPTSPGMRSLSCTSLADSPHSATVVESRLARFKASMGLSPNWIVHPQASWLPRLRL